MAIEIKDMETAQLGEILQLNNSATPGVNELDPTALKKLSEMACYFRVAISDGKLAGFLIAIPHHTEYQSRNYRWFQSHYPEFIYIDRVVVGKNFRGLGIGRIIYADIQSFSELRAPVLTCEVNLEPRNDVSLLFHGTNGFNEVGQLKHDDIGYLVSLQAKELSSYEFVRKQAGENP